MSDELKDGTTNWYNWMRDTKKIDPSDAKSISLVWSVVGRSLLDEDLRQAAALSAQAAKYCACVEALKEANSFIKSLWPTGDDFKDGAREYIVKKAEAALAGLEG